MKTTRFRVQGSEKRSRLRLKGNRIFRLAAAGTAALLDGDSRAAVPAAAKHLIITFLFLLLPDLLSAQSADELAGAPAWQPPAVGEVRTQAFAWLDNKKADEAVKSKARELWTKLAQPPTEEEVLDCLARTFALADADAEKLVALCSQPPSGLMAPPQSWLGDARTAPFLARNLRLYYARWLVQNARYDEAQAQLAGLQIADVVAPAALLFYQSVIAEKLLDRESGLRTLDQLLEGPSSAPQRYLAVARLMREDLLDLEEDSLDHISRRMDDIGRRLGLGRAGPKVRRLEDGVIESLDQWIKKLEEEEQKRRSSANSGNSIRSRSPAPESRFLAGKGPGVVEKKNLGGQSGWGDLPPKEREEALQQIGRDFPAQYHDVVEEYFKRLAAEENPEP